jgi:hypothetical protein
LAPLDADQLSETDKPLGDALIEVGATGIAGMVTLLDDTHAEQLVLPLQALTL